MSIYHLEDVWRSAVRLVACVCLLLLFVSSSPVVGQSLSDDARARAVESIRTARAEKLATPSHFRNVSRVVLDAISSPRLAAGRLAVDVTLENDNAAADVVSLVGSKYVMGQTDKRMTISIVAADIGALSQLDGVGRITPNRPMLSGSQAPIYNDVFVDTDPATSYSFPDDAHDFCKAEFDDLAAAQDYTLGAFISGPTDFELTWNDEGEALSDFDLYLLDENGYKVGNVDGQFPTGFNGTDFQDEANPNRVETAHIDYSGAETFVTVVIDRFRGSGNAELSVTATAGDGAFRASEYQGVQHVFVVDGGNVSPTALASGDTLRLNELSTPVQFNLEFRTDVICAQSAHFNLSQPTEPHLNTDSAKPFTLFGSNGIEPAVGDYQLEVTPYALQDAMGNPGEVLNINFVIEAGPPPPVGILHFSLINTKTDSAIVGFDPIPEGAVLDIAKISSSLKIQKKELNIRANMHDPDTLVESVRFNLDWPNDDDGHNTVERGRPYALFGDWHPVLHAKDNTANIDPPDIPVYNDWKNGTPINGSYFLVATPFTADKPSDGNPKQARTLNFTITNGTDMLALISGLDDAPILFNFPNPFNPTTTIRFGLPETQHVELRVFDMLGREIDVLLHGVREAGFHEIPFNAYQLASGVYLYQLRLEAGLYTRRMVVMK